MHIKRTVLLLTTKCSASTGMGGGRVVGGGRPIPGVVSEVGETRSLLQQW